jgi:hypothetical protein
MKRVILLIAAASLAQTHPIHATMIDFFDASQSYALVESGTTFDTVLTEGYLITYTRDKLFTGGLEGGPIGRPVSIDWPTGLQAQAVTAGPNPGVAKFMIRRLDVDVFDMPAFTFKLLANTFGTGASVEIMPKLDGEDAFADPVMFNASGSAGMSFSYDTTTPVFLGNTSTLQDSDTSDVKLFVDFAFTDLKVAGPIIPNCSPPPFC